MSNVSDELKFEARNRLCTKSEECNYKSQIYSLTALAYSQMATDNVNTHIFIGIYAMSLKTPKISWPKC